MAALNAPAPLDLRVNALKADRDTARRALAAEHIHAEPTPWSPLGLRLKHRAPLGRDGRVQGRARRGAGRRLATRGAARRCAPRHAGRRFLRRRRRQDAGARRPDAEPRQARRLRCRGVAARTRRHAAAPRRDQQCRAPRRSSSERDHWVKHHAKSFDRVFVDAPCLGIGSWRRNPDGKWRATPAGPRRTRAAPARHPAPAPRVSSSPAAGSSMRPARCCARKTRRRPRNFSPPHPDFALYPAARAWAETIGGESPGGDDYLRLTPARHGTDGFFVASSSAPDLRASRTHDRPHPDPRFRQPGHAADRPPGARERRLLRDPALHGRPRTASATSPRAAIILSGGPASVTRADTPRAPDIVFRLGVPVLGICYGMQTMCAQLGGRVTLERASGIRPRLYRHHSASAGCSTGCGRKARASRSG